MGSEEGWGEGRPEGKSPELVRRWGAERSPKHSRKEERDQSTHLPP